MHAHIYSRAALLYISNVSGNGPTTDNPQRAAQLLQLLMQMQH